jgi:hypothetical protein
MAGLDRVQQFMRLIDAELGRLAFRDLVLDAGDGGEGVESDGVALYQDVEKLPESRESLVLGGLGTLDLAEIVTGNARRDVAQLQLGGGRTRSEIVRRSGHRRASYVRCRSRP